MAGLVRGLWGAFALLVGAIAGCDDASVVPDPSAVAANSAPAVAAPTVATVEPTPASNDPLTAPRITKPVAQRALSWLEQQVRLPAGDPESPWAMAHGLLAFGQDFKTRDGKSAVETIASFAQHTASGEGEGRTERYGFPALKDGKPVEPHSDLLVKTFLEIGLKPTLSLRTADGSLIDVQRLLTDMRARVRTPQNDHDWHDAAWWLSALAIDPTTDDAMLAPLMEAALRRLEADDGVIVAAAAQDPTGIRAFDPAAPMGAAKRNKTHVYGHPCGGLHFFQAVLRGAKRHPSSDFATRAGRQVQLLIARHNAERALYAQILSANPASMLLISGQQLKFFGHLLETLALANEVGPLRQDFTLAQAITAARQQAASDLLGVLAQLEQAGAYARLNELSVSQPQLYLDLIGDGCHAIHGLRETLPVLPVQ